MNEYLNRVMVYLKQELPEKFGHSLKANKDKIIFILPDDVNFNAVYTELHKAVSESVKRIRELETDLHFSVKSTYQERDFSVLKNFHQN